MARRARLAAVAAPGKAGQWGSAAPMQSCHSPNFATANLAGGFAIPLTSITAPWLCSMTLEDRAARAPSTPSRSRESSGAAQKEGHSSAHAHLQPPALSCLPPHEGLAPCYGGTCSALATQALSSESQLCHLRGTRATLSPEGRKPVKPHSPWELSSTHCPLPGGRQLESSSTLSLSRAGMAASCPPCHTPMAPTCSELSQAPPRSPHVSAHSLHHQTRAGHKARPSLAGRVQPVSSILLSKQSTAD